MGIMMAAMMVAAGHDGHAATSSPGTPPTTGPTVTGTTQEPAQMGTTQCTMTTDYWFYDFNGNHTWDPGVDTWGGIIDQSLSDCHTAPGESSCPIQQSCDGTDGQHGGPANNTPTPCQGCFIQLNNCQNGAKTLEQQCIYNSLSLAKEKCEEGVSIDGKVVTPAKFAPICHKELQVDEWNDWPKNKKYRLVCTDEPVWQDPAGCLQKWIDGIKGSTTTTGSTATASNPKGKTPDETSLSTETTTTVTIEPQIGIMQSCLKARIADQQRCSTESGTCQNANCKP
jgi:hypothetical protein